jgi:hypothetical protein
MKKIILLFSLAATIQCSFAQYKPMPMQNAEWINYGGINLFGCPQCTFVQYKYYTDGDTLINTQLYVKIKKTESPNLNDVSTYPTYTGAIRQDTLNKKIYVILSDSTTERILYDFSLQVGDTINSVLHDLAANCFGFNTEIITSIDSIQVNGNYHRVFHFQGSCTGPNGGSYIEGIGSDFGLLFPNRMDETESHLSCLKVNNQTYYPNSSGPCELVVSITSLEENNEFTIFPNPVTETITITLPTESDNHKACSLLDASGREITTLKLIENETKVDVSELYPGIYFVKIGDRVEKLVVE